MSETKVRPVRAPDLRRWKADGRKVAMLTAYDAESLELHERLDGEARIAAMLCLRCVRLIDNLAPPAS